MSHHRKHKVKKKSILALLALLAVILPGFARGSHGAEAPRNHLEPYAGHEASQRASERKGNEAGHDSGQKLEKPATIIEGMDTKVRTRR